MINSVTLTGRLTKDPELRYTPNDVPVTQFIVAVNRNFKNKNNEIEADFINCVLWQKSAEVFCRFMQKGSLVGLEGRLQSRTYDNQQGQRVYVTELVVANFSFLESSNQKQKSPDPSAALSESGKPTPTTTVAADDANVSQDDLPF